MENIEEKYKYIHFIEQKKENNYHKQITNIIKYLINSDKEIPNLILYGPEGSGKYSIGLEIIEKLSKTKLKYEKRCNLEKNKEELTFKLSDIHYELDINKLSCNQKTSFINYYEHIRDIIKTKKVFEKNINQKINGIILIKNFDNISYDLLNIFDNFIKYDNLFLKDKLNIKFILITKNLSFIPEKITNLFEVIHISKPLLTKIKKELKCNYNLNEIDNLRMFNNKNNIFTKKYENYDNMIEILNKKNINIEELRNIIYNILIYQEDELEFIYKIIKYLIKKNIDLNNIIEKVEYFKKYYINNYRPIFHLENLFISFYLLLHKK